jgi:hypothetical protein
VKLVSTIFKTSGSTLPAGKLNIPSKYKNKTHKKKMFVNRMRKEKLQKRKNLKMISKAVHSMARP